MAKIVYGVSGEGSGHSSRAREMAAHLISSGHQVRIASYDRGYRNLHEDFDVLPIAGLTIVSVNNKVSIVKTLIKNIKALAHIRHTFKTLRQKLFDDFKPDCVISDFEPMSAYLAKRYKLPLISLDNQHRMRYMEYPPPPGQYKDALITKMVIRAMIPKPDVSLIITFYYGKIKNQHSFLFPPILRKEILELTPTKCDHILVYTTWGFDALVQQLKQFTQEHFIVYGYDHTQENKQEGNIQFKPFSKTHFLTDLASAKAVIATAGFTLMTESLHLGKPYLALPMQGQFEQVLNAHMLQEAGYGMQAKGTDIDKIVAFLGNLSTFEHNLQQYPKQGNTAIIEKLDKLLADDLAELKSLASK